MSSVEVERRIADCRYVPAFDRYELTIAAKLRDGTFEVASPGEFVRHKLGEGIAPTLVFGDEMAQLLVDALWKAGLRPSMDKAHKPADVQWMQDQLAKFINKATR